MGLDPKQIVNVAVTPCTAKKFEIRREEMNAAGKYLGIDGMRDMDYVITTRELAKWAKEESIDFTALEDSEFDRLMGEASGAGVIFGNTGGVMEAALRTAYQYIMKEPAPAQFFQLTPVRGMDAVKEAEVSIGSLKLKAAVIFGTKAASQFIKKWRETGEEYHFVEVMTCPGGCIGGGGQPKGTLFKGDELRKARVDGLYKRDSEMKLRSSHENSEIVKLYEEFYKEPLSELAEEMLHTSYMDRSADLGTAPLHQEEPVGAAQEKQTEKEQDGAVKYRCKVCGYIHEGELPEGFTCPLCKQPAKR